MRDAFSKPTLKRTREENDLVDMQLNNLKKARAQQDPEKVKANLAKGTNLHMQRNQANRKVFLGEVMTHNDHPTRSNPQNAAPITKNRSSYRFTCTPCGNKSFPLSEDQLREAKRLWEESERQSNITESEEVDEN